MKPYEDDLSDIERALEHVFKSDANPGGFVVLATDEEEVLGAAVIHYTPWGGYGAHTHRRGTRQLRWRYEATR